ncbi:320_t:CDS:2, partial [Cetraspora pellucida]
MVDEYKVFVFAIGHSSCAKWKYASSGFQSSIIHIFERTRAIFVLRIENNDFILEIFQNSEIKKKYIDTNPNDVWKQSDQIQKFKEMQLFGLEDSIIQKLISKRFLMSSPIHIQTSTNKFWSCFDHVLEDNKHTLNEKRRILSIIVDEFSYFELQHNLD